MWPKETEGGKELAFALNRSPPKELLESCMSKQGGGEVQRSGRRREPCWKFAWGGGREKEQSDRSQPRSLSCCCCCPICASEVLKVGEGGGEEGSECAPACCRSRFSSSRDASGSTARSEASVRGAETESRQKPRASRRARRQKDHNARQLSSCNVKRE